MNARAQLGLSFLFSPGSPAKEWSCHIQHRSSHFINPVYELPHRHPHRFVSKVILDLSDCWTVESQGFWWWYLWGRDWEHGFTIGWVATEEDAEQQLPHVRTQCKSGGKPASLLPPDHAAKLTSDLCPQKRRGMSGHFILIWKHVLLNTSSQIPETEPKHSREGQWAFK